ncbi:hypothetical protein H696_03427 [Fonticula alba]|uniref:Uncharacterized protein n=1 Tax=Fonticula alba TaxID=691883 RepID=A0A058Z8Z7_FONAL|nr:hypothetical protein H696_03427 [Fonticula alba]KCV69962.1 hypothetical protein H696_03427 [Fonticula alba]|eukprot:XP_009495568.1 hypothetical protein H696_03427 [Fonticula alba]
MSQPFDLYTAPNYIEEGNIEANHISSAGILDFRAAQALVRAHLRSIGVVNATGLVQDEAYSGEAPHYSAGVLMDGTRLYYDFVPGPGTPNGPGILTTSVLLYHFRRVPSEAAVATIRRRAESSVALDEWRRGIYSRLARENFKLTIQQREQVHAHGHGYGSRPSSRAGSISPKRRPVVPQVDPRKLPPMVLTYEPTNLGVYLSRRWESAPSSGEMAFCIATDAFVQLARALRAEVIGSEAGAGGAPIVDPSGVSRSAGFLSAPAEQISLAQWQAGAGGPAASGPVVGARRVDSPSPVGSVSHAPGTHHGLRPDSPGGGMSRLTALRRKLAPWRSSDSRGFKHGGDSTTFHLGDPSSVQYHYAREEVPPGSEGAHPGAGADASGAGDGAQAKTPRILTPVSRMIHESVEASKPGPPLDVLARQTSPRGTASPPVSFAGPGPGPGASSAAVSASPGVHIAGVESATHLGRPAADSPALGYPGSGAGGGSAGHLAAGGFPPSSSEENLGLLGQPSRPITTEPRQMAGGQPEGSHDSLHALKASSSHDSFITKLASKLPRKLQGSRAKELAAEAGAGDVHGASAAEGKRSRFASPKVVIPPGQARPTGLPLKIYSSHTPSRAMWGGSDAGIPRANVRGGSPAGGSPSGPSTGGRQP